MSATHGAGVPLCDLLAQYRELRPQLEAALGRVLASGQVILGPEVAALEEELARYCGAAFAVGCGSGTDAIRSGVLLFTNQSFCTFANTRRRLAGRGADFRCSITRLLSNGRTWLVATIGLSWVLREVR